MNGTELFAGGGETGALMARLDWAGTPVGPVTGWPQHLRTAVRLVLSSRYPMLLLWGDDFIQLYNDAYSALIGDKHPAALGIDVRITLAEGWDVLRPIIDRAVTTGVASWVPALQLRLDRAGYPEEAYFSVSHAAARDDRGATVGVFAVCSEVTDQVVGERRLRLLRELSVRAEQSRTVGRTCEDLMAGVAAHPLDVPFAAVYLRDGGLLRRMAGVGIPGSGPAGDAVLPAVVPLEPDPADQAGDPWSLRRAAGGQVTAVADVAARIRVAAGPWGDPVATALALPLPSADPSQPLGVLLAAVSPSRGLDEAYRSFFELLSQQVSVAVRNARGYEEERARAEALAELDRVKTGFFTNVSHELRTPLTLMLGPLSDALADADDRLSPGQRDRVDTAWRNATRLLKLVNNLLTFASLQAGRATRAPRLVDLSALTTEVVGVFRAAVERAGLRLVVQCPPLPRPVAVDPNHWETIVANLLSNALKFTFVGQLRVALEADDTAVRLTVADTGIGIAAPDQSRLFERFHRVQGARSRSHEGTGIGLALVQELTRLQGGEVQVSSAVGAGTTFTVLLPWSAVQGGDPAGPPGAAAGGPGAAQEAAQEALQWFAGDGPATAAEPAADPSGVDSPVGADPLHGARIVVADDNADMRAYLTRLLTAQGWRVQAVQDGAAALEAVRQRRPDLVLTDVMMPRLDGFQLVRVLRREEATRTVPIVVLSARAGREASVEGLEMGADDYVVKPFSAPELMARIRATMQLARARGAPAAPAAAAADAATLIASGRALEAAVRLLTAQARALLGGRQAVTTFTDPAGAPVLRVAVPADAGEDPDPPVSSVPVPATGPGPPVGTLAVRGGESGAGGRDRLRPVTRMLATLATGGWEPAVDPPIAATVRRALLAQRLPDIAGCELAGRSLPADGGVGAHWYDAWQLPDGRLLLSVGDVAGCGLPAVSVMGHLRAGIRAYAAREDQLSTVLSRLDDLVRRLAPAAPATVLLGCLDPATGQLHWAGAGQPAPVQVAPGRPAVRLPGVLTPPLGVPAARPPAGRAELPPDHVLLFCTAASVGEPGALPNLPSGTGQLPDFVEAVLTDRDGAPRDRLAVVGVRRAVRQPTNAAKPISDVDGRWSYQADPHAAAAMRRDLRRSMQQANVDDDVIFEVLVAASEAVNNAVEHAQRPSRPEVETRLTISGGLVRVTVQDFGSWRGRQPAMDRGRGAALMSAYADVRVESSERGTTVVIERSAAAVPGGDG